MIMIKIGRGMTQNDLTGALTNLMINGLHRVELWSVGANSIADFRLRIADLTYKNIAHLKSEI
jgi:hypothetical protein